MTSSWLLKGKRFEQKPKPVRKAPDFQDYCGVGYNLQRRNQLYEVIDCIESGQPIPPEYYKSNLDAHGDRLLRELGVKHLHLDGPGSDVVVYMAEFEDWVELIEINGHVHLETEPRGKDLKGQFLAAALGAAAGAAMGAAVGKSARKAKRKKRPKT